MTNPRSVRPCAVAFATALALLLPGGAQAIEHQVKILLDLDNNVATGCAVATPDGPFDGVEQQLVTTVETSGPPPAGMVTDVALADCIDPVADTFGPPTSFDGQWPVGIDNGEFGFDVVETYVGLLQLVVQSPDVIRIGVVVTDELGGARALLTVNDQPGGPSILLDLRRAPEIPTLGEWGLLLLAVLLAGAAVALVGRRGAAVLVTVLLVLAASALWAAGSLDGQIGDWAGDSPVASGDIVLFAKEMAGKLCFRVDLPLLFDQPPTAVADVATVVEDDGATAIDVLANDTDPDGGPKTVDAVQNPSTNGGTVLITGGGTGVSYQPAANYCNTPPGSSLDTFTYTLNGGSMAMVSVTVTCVDDLPTAVADSATVGEDSGATAIDVLANDTDPDSGVTTIASASDPANGTVVLTGGSPGAHTGLTYQPDPNYCNNPPPGTFDTFTYTINGGSMAIVSVTVTCVAEPPAIDLDANDDKGTVGADFAVTFTEGDAAKLLEDPADATLTDVDSTELVSLTVKLTNLLDAGVEVLDADVSGFPNITKDYDTTTPGVGLLTLSSLAPEPLADYQAVLRTVTYVNTSTDPDGTARVVEFVADDGGLVSNTAKSTVTVTAVDAAPVAVDDTATVAEDAAATPIHVLANDTDTDGGTKTVDLVSQPANGTVVITNAGADLTYEPDADYCNSGLGGSPDTFNYTLNGGSMATVSVTVTCVDDDPTAVADSATVAEDASATPIDVLANDTDPDGGTKVITSAGDPANGTVALTGGSPGANTGLTYQPDADYCNNPPGTFDTFTYTITGGSMATVSVTVTCVDDAPTAVADAATVIEDSGANLIAVQANDTDPDGGTNTVSMVTQPAHGSVVINAGNTTVSYAPAQNYCNNPPGTMPDSFTYTLSPGSSVGTVTVTVTCVNDPPVADNDAFDFIGNTELRVDTGAVSTPHALETTPTTGGVLDGDSDPAEGNAVAVSSITVGACTDNTLPTFDCTDPAVGTVHMQANGRFSFEPAAGDTDASETFQYVATDDGAPPASTTAMVTLTRFERVWYVNPGAGGGGTGTSLSPFGTLDPLDGAGGAGDSDSTGDYIFIFNGTLALSGPMPMEANQHLIGNGVALSIPVNLNGNGSPTNLVSAGTKPQVTNATGDAVTIGTAIPIEIVGLSLASTTGNTIDLTSAAALSGSPTLTIGTNEVRGAGAEGIDVNLNGGTTGTLNLAISSNTWNTGGTHAGNAVDVNRAAGTLNLSFNGNTNIKSSAGGVVINGGAVASTTITGFSNNSVHASTGGLGISISNATFDANTVTGGFQQVDGDNLAIGIAGDDVGGAGLTLSTVQGNLFFDDLDVFGTSGVTVSGTGGGMTFAVTPAPPDGIGSSVVRGSNGAALDVTSATIDLRFDDLDSTTPGTGVSLSGVGGTFKTDSDASIVKSSGAGTAFSVANSVSGASITYAGTMNVTSGSGVSLANNTGSTIAFTGLLTLNTGASAAFSATGGGTVSSTAAGSTLKTTSATALTVTNTTIGGSGLLFQCISAGRGNTGGSTCDAGAASGSPVNGIVLNTTGSLGGLTVSGSGAANSGGIIQAMTGAGIDLTSTRSVSLTRMLIQNGADDGIRGNGVTNFTFASGSVLNNGNAVQERGADFTNLLGTATISASTFSGNAEDNLYVINNSATALTLTVTGSTFSSTSSTFGNDGIHFHAQSGANMSIDVSGSTFAANRGDHLQATTDAAVSGTTTVDVVFQNNTLSGGCGGMGCLGAGLTLNPAGNATMTFDISGNGTGGAPWTGAFSSAITINNSPNTLTTESPDLIGTIANNVIGNPAVTDSGSASGDCITVFSNGNGNTVVRINGNSLRECSNLAGINLHQRDGDGTLDATVTGNTISDPGTFAANAILAQAGAVAGDGGIACFDIGGAGALANSFAGAGANGATDFRVRQRVDTTVRLPGYGGANSDTGAVVSFIQGRNNGAETGSATFSASGGGFVNAACVLP